MKTYFVNKWLRRYIKEIPSIIPVTESIEQVWTIHNLLFGLMSLAKPGMALQNDAISSVDLSCYGTNGL